MFSRNIIISLVTVLLVRGAASCGACRDHDMPDVLSAPFMEFKRLPKVFSRKVFPSPTAKPTVCDTITNSIHEVRIMRLCDPIPDGWRVLTYDEGQCMRSELQQMLTQWSIVAFNHGDLRGPGYGNALDS